MLVCDKCNAGINEGSKFCPQCGDPVTDLDRITIPVTEAHVANVEIVFGQSSSPNLNKAIDICKNIPSYTVLGEGKQLQHKISLPITEVDLIMNVFDLVGSWKTSKMLINGHSATKKDLTYYGVGCFRNRTRAYEAEQFCFGESEYESNIWGCKRLNMPISQWGGGWLDYGEFDELGIWYFDKGKIKHELEIKLKENELCPVLDRNKVLETLEKLPNSINPKVDSNWDYRTSYENVSGGYKEVAIGIKPVINTVNKFVVGGFKPSWDVSERESRSNSDYVMDINAEIEDFPKDNPLQSPHKSNVSLKMVWWIVFAVALGLFLLSG